jgi:hypothetical protein
MTQTADGVKLSAHLGGADMNPHDRQVISRTLMCPQAYGEPEHVGRPQVLGVRMHVFQVKCVWTAVLKINASPFCSKQEGSKIRKDKQKTHGQEE